MSKILIVEDEESIADLEKDYLELSGFEVEVANDGQTGLDKALFGDFDLVILDLMLPGVDGFEICRKAFKGVFDRNARKVLAFSSDGRANGVNIFIFNRYYFTSVNYFFFF